MKRCFKCLAEKELSEFYKHPQMKDGYLGKCKECARADVKNNYASKLGKYVEYERARRMLPDRRAKQAEYAKKSRLKDSSKYHARCMVNNAIRDGRLVRGPCEVCGCPKAEAHHDDYFKPLDVRWLCFRCHMEVHGNTAISRQRHSDKRQRDL